ncbi:MAG: 1-acyl-sn-glycerol-3-phosphate acyltransferase [Clostridia bacterium]|nr:1-acyl-sn-glycerol-3-phosphate acyltransferase [Clostridia bacterium]
MWWLIRWFIKITGWIAHVFYFRKKVYYEDRKVQGRRIKGKAIVMSNHHAIMDFALSMYLFPFRSLRCQVAEVLYEKNFMMTFMLKVMGCIKVDRNAHDFSFLESSKKVLDKGGVIQIFPEARLPKKEEQKPLPFKPSISYLALDTGVKIIPVYTNGKYGKRERCRVIIGKPIYVRDWYDQAKTERENLAIITEKLREKVVSLAHELESKKEKKNRQ